MVSPASQGIHPHLLGIHKNKSLQGGTELLWDTAAPFGPGLVPTVQPWLSFLLLQPKAQHPRDLPEGEADKETNATQ